MQLGRWIRVLFVLLAASAFSVAAHAEGRVALVIGNSAYEHLPVLDSPRNDATAVAAKLQRLGFTVITGIDLDRAATAAKLQQFQQALANADTALFYYAGHGLKVSDRDYLVPIDANLANAADPEHSIIDLSAVLSSMEHGPDVGLVFFDASRDNPLPPTVEPSTGHADAPASPHSAGMVIAFATGPGRTAIHGLGDAHSPFTGALLQYMDTPGLRIQDLLAQVRNSVVESTAGRQLPWDSSSLGYDFFLAGP